MNKRIVAEFEVEDKKCEVKSRTLVAAADGSIAHWERIRKFVADRSISGEEIRQIFRKPSIGHGHMGSLHCPLCMYFTDYDGEINCNSCLGKIGSDCMGKGSAWQEARDIVIESIFSKDHLLNAVDKMLGVLRMYRRSISVDRNEDK